MKPLLLLLVGGLFCASALAGTAEEGVKRLEIVWAANDSGDIGEEKFIRASKEIADRHGIALITPVMKRAKEWKGEEGLIYALMIALLPREDATRELKKYQQKEGTPEAIWAGEYLTEFEADDVEEVVKRLRQEKP